MPSVLWTLTKWNNQEASKISRMRWCNLLGGLDWKCIAFNNMMRPGIKTFSALISYDECRPRKMTQSSLFSQKTTIDEFRRTMDKDGGNVDLYLPVSRWVAQGRRRGSTAHWAHQQIKIPATVILGLWRRRPILALLPFFKNFITTASQSADRLPTREG